uniref:Transcription repressor n=1 Tax=Rhizophora mucronata TaxID=61149 RepID=A0A2P2MDG5_RHIMU
MGMKMKLPFLTPYCHEPRTSSFRTRAKMLLKTINSAYLDATNVCGTMDMPEPLFTNSSESSASFSTESDESSGGDLIETVIRGARSERLFFEPGETSSILEEVPKAAPAGGGRLPFKESLVFSMESYDPHLDFMKSMEEMVKACGLKDWEDLEELLFSYLKVNGRNNHGYIICAFVDLLVGLAFASSSSSSPSAPISNDSCSCPRSPSSSPLSFYTSFSSSDDGSRPKPWVSSLGQEAVEEEIIDIISPRYSSLEAEDENVIKAT